jgi:hypothetical protein
MAKKNKPGTRRTVDEEKEPPHGQSPTAIAADAARRGVPPPEVLRPESPEIPGEDEVLKIGDSEVDPLRNAYAGEESPGFDMATPDQDGVDAAGQAYGVAEADSGALKPSAEIAEARDRRRAFQEEPEPTEE